MSNAHKFDFSPRRDAQREPSVIWRKSEGFQSIPEGNSQWNSLPAVRSHPPESGAAAFRYPNKTLAESGLHVSLNKISRDGCGPEISRKPVPSTPTDGERELPAHLVSLDGKPASGRPD